MKKSSIPDPFAQARETSGQGEMQDQYEPVVMILGHQDVRRCAHNWKTFQSGATPGRIVVPSEEKIRTVRQIPFEVDPPLHKTYRNLMESWFKRPLQPEYQKKLEQIIGSLIQEAVQKDKVELVSEFSLPLQSMALTLLLNIPISEAQTWISWGTHVFRSDSSKLDGDKANILYDYIDNQIDYYAEHPENNMYSVLLNSEIDGRKLNKEEVKGVMILTFAGGRDTVINAVTNAIAYLAEHPQSLTQLRTQPEIAGRAVEEFIRYFSPLTHMGRVATSDTQVGDRKIASDEKISLCWASANRDKNVFENPDDVIVDRKINPHVGFGFGHHKCLGATHARQILKILILEITRQVSSIDIIDTKENIEEWGDFRRKVGFDRIEVRFNK